MKKLKLTQNDINEISQELQGGMKIFINKSTLEIKSILDWDFTFGDTDFWEDEFEKLQKEWDDYIVITKMESWQAFKIMEDFIEEVDDSLDKAELIKILNRKKPFANFKYAVESSKYREPWFQFRNKYYEEYVKECLENEKIEFQ
jgi:hypothetical protein